MLHRVRDSAVLKVDSVEALLVVAQRQVLIDQELMVGLQQVNVLILLPAVFVRQPLQRAQRLLAGRIGWEAGEASAAEDHQVRHGVSLPVPVGEEEVFVPHDGTADAEAVLIVVIGTLRPFVDHVDVVVRVEPLVAVVIEHRAVEVIRARLGDDVDHRAAGPAVLGRV